MSQDKLQRTKSIQRYYDALDRLLEQGAKISFDSVSLEAGRGRGAIKGDSAEIFELKKYILSKKTNNSATSNTQVTEDNSPEDSYTNLKLRYNQLEIENQMQAERLISLVYELHETKKKLSDLLASNNNIIKFRE